MTFIKKYIYSCVFLILTLKKNACLERIAAFARLYVAHFMTFYHTTSEA